MNYLDLNVVGVLIKQMRLASGITQKELSIRSGISRATISALENGRLNDVGVKTLGSLFKSIPYSHKSENISERSCALGEYLSDYRTKVANESVESFSTRAGLIVERVKAMESGDGSVSLNEWLMAFSCMQVLPDVMDAAKPAMAILGSMFESAIWEFGFGNAE